MLDKYRVERLVGLGGMGVVMEARLLQLDERVAMKFLLPELGASPEAVARFEREAKMLFKIKSHHVCRVHEFARLPNGVPFIVMEYLEGRDLANGFITPGGIPLGLAVGYVLQACHAIAEAHARGIVHRDLKPENFFLDESQGDCLKVLDFGLSKFAVNSAEGRRERQLTAQQQAMGTPQYMAPEQWVSATDVGPAADQWALGAILFELLTGRPPFDAEDIPKICTRTLNAPTPSVHERRPDIPAGIDLVIRKCLEKSPAQRYENVGAFAVALAAFAPPAALAAAERLRAMLNTESDPDASRKLFPASATKMPSMPSDLRPTMRRVPERDQDSWKRILAAMARRRRPSLALWMTIGSALAATLILFVLLATQAADPEAIEAPTTSTPAPPEALPRESKAAEAPASEPPTTPATASATPRATPPRAAPSASASAAPQPSSSGKLFDRRW